MIDVNSIRVDRNGHGVYVKTAIMSHRLFFCQDKVDLRLTKILIFSCISNTKTIWNEDETVDVRKNYDKTAPNTSRHNTNVTADAKTECSSVALVNVEASQLDEQIKTMMTRTENDKRVGTRIVKVYSCNVCGKEDQGPHIKQHIEANHITNNISHSCDICGKISRSRDGLRQHKHKEHKTPFFSGPNMP